ncbi:UNVERIFIED_CONTAM: hypothetical protein GTU68_008242 [Idotea baltica]|nr:hypothetical protein [Idotea baltica]
MIKLEVCIDSVAGAKAAEKGGANRVELCDNLVEGGTTPSFGMVEQCLESSNLPVMMMIRPRGGDFLYDKDEFEVMKRNVLHARTLGVMGVVFGMLTAEGDIDRAQTAQLVEAAGPLSVTFHRAFDMCRNPHKGLELLKELGIARILTSGQESSAHEGIPLIRELIDLAGDQLIIMPGGGVNEKTLPDIVRLTQAKECHTSAKTTFPSKMKYFNPKVYMGVPGSAEYEIKSVSAKRVAAILRTLDSN